MNWMKYKFFYLILSGLIIIPGLFSLWKFGLRLSIEFTGGSRMVVSAISQKPEDIAAAFKDYEPNIESSDKNSVTLKMKDISQDNVNKTIESLKKANANIKVSEFESIGPALGSETIKKTVNALLVVSCLLILYISYAFKNAKFGVTAVVAALHDSLVLLGIFSLLGHFMHVEVDLLFVTALLTILSYSVHDTIVVYDRIRELSHREKYLSFTELVNHSITQTMARSLNNSLTVIFMLLAMVLIGGESIRYFSLALLIGTITGTYSSTFTAAPLLVIWDDIQKNKRK